MKWLNYTNLSDEYERKARFLPAVLCLLPLLPASAALGGPVFEWLKLVLGGVGIGAVLAVGLSHVASAMGNRLQNRLWPRWPFDSPTNRWLHPKEERTSPQQRAIWYAAIERLVGIDIAVAVSGGNGLEATINDATSQLRNLFWELPEAKRLRLHNGDYGFARNITGMRPIWIGLLVASALVCWVTYAMTDTTALLWAVVSSLFAVILIPVGICVLPGYVNTRAVYYAESFFATLMALDKASVPSESAS